MQDQVDSKAPPRKARSLRSIYELCDGALFSCESQIFKEAMQDDSWREAMDKEISPIEKNRTWELLDLSEGKDMIRLTWVYKTKYKEDGTIQKYKACFVAKCYSRQPKVDLNETSPQLLA